MCIRKQEKYFTRQVFMTADARAVYYQTVVTSTLLTIAMLLNEYWAFPGYRREVSMHRLSVFHSCCVILTFLDTGDRLVHTYKEPLPVSTMIPSSNRGGVTLCLTQTFSNTGGAYIN